MTILKIDINFYNKEAQEHQLDNKKTHYFFTFYISAQPVNYPINDFAENILYSK